MWRLAYRNFGSRQVLVGNFTTDVNGNDRAGVRWFELRKIGSGAWCSVSRGYVCAGDAQPLDGHDRHGWLRQHRPGLQRR